MSTVEALAELEKLCKLEDPHKVYTNMVKIGEGYLRIACEIISTHTYLFFIRASGSVFKARKITESDAKNEEPVYVAIKQIHLRRQIRKDLIVDEVRMGIENRSQRNMVQHIESYLYKHDVWIVMEYMEGGSLTDIVTQNFMSEREIAAVCREVLQGLDYLHSRGIIHRDIKSDNILIGMEGQIKLCKYSNFIHTDKETYI